MIATNVLPKNLPVSKSTNLNKFNMTEIDTYNYIILFRLFFFFFIMYHQELNNCTTVKVLSTIQYDNIP